MGGVAGMAVAWTYHTLMMLWISPEHGPLPAVPYHSPAAGRYHAIIVPAGGQRDDGAPPPHVMARLELAAALYTAAREPKPFVITTAWGTPHKPCPHDVAGFERHEAADNAASLLSLGVSPSHLLEESVSLETVGNAYFTRLLHTEVRGLRRLAVINNHFHMPRTRAVFEHVFSVPPAKGEPRAQYELSFLEVKRLVEIVRG